jgi:hypothetical protein
LGYYPFNPINIKADYGVGGNSLAYGQDQSGEDRASIVNVGYTALIPFGRGMLFGANSPGYVNALLGGWSTSGVWVAASGLPFTPFVSSNTSLNADFSQVPNRVNGAPLYSNRSFSHWFNNAAFAIPACCQYGNVAPGLLRGPGLFKPDLAVWKEWKFGVPHLSEAFSIQFRAEALNAFNHVNAGLPNNDVDNPAVGEITSLQFGQAMRELQFGLHLRW